MITGSPKMAVRAAAAVLVFAQLAAAQDAGCGMTDVEHVHTTCCPPGVDCSGEFPPTCSGQCSSVFLDFADRCSDFLARAPPATAAEFNSFGILCRQSFGACNTAADCGTSGHAQCVSMLGCTRPPCSRCICSSGYDGDGHTCTPAAPPPPPPTPAVMSGNHAPTVVTAPSSHDASAGSDDPRQQGFFSLQASAGVTYTITVTLGDLSDSVLEVWTGPRNHPTFVSRNDDANGGLGSELELTPPTTGTYYIIVHSFSSSQRGSYTLTIASSGHAGGGNGHGDPCSASGAVEAGNGGTIDFTHGYTASATCQWHIMCRGRDRHPAVHFTAFDTEANYDFVTLYDGGVATAPQLAHLSGALASLASTNYEGSGGSMLVSLTADQSVAGTGFSMTYTCGSPVLPPSTPPAPPHQISPNQNVTGNIASGGDIEFYRFTATGGAAYQISTALGSLSDSVVLVYACQGAVVDAGVCTELAFNDDAPSSTEGSHTLASYLDWTAPSGGTFYIAVRGFSQSETGTFSVLLSQPTAAGSGACGSAGATLSNGRGTVSFTPAQYVNNAHCSWTVACRPGSLPTIQMVSLNTEARYDTLTLYDGPAATSTALATLSGSLATGTVRRVYQGHAAEMLLEFHSDGSVSGTGGFELHYQCARSAGQGQGPTDTDCTPVRLGSHPAEGVVTDTAPIKYFCLRGSLGTTYDITVNLGSMTDSVLDVYAASDLRTALAHNDDANGGLASYVEWTAPATGMFFIAVRSFRPTSPGDFTLTVNQLTDGGGGGDASHTDSPCLRSDGTGGSTISRANGAISFASETCSDNCNCQWTLHCHTGQVPSVHFPAFSTELNFDTVTLYDGATSLSTSLITPALSGHSIQDPTRPSPTQEYHATQSSMLIAFHSDGSVSSHNAFQVAYTCGSPAGTPALPLQIPIQANGQPTTGTITSGPVVYAFAATAGITYQLRTDLQTLEDSVLELYGPDGITELAHNDDYQGPQSYIEWTCPRTSQYIVHVRAFSTTETGSFSLTITGHDDPSNGGPCAGGLAVLGGDSGTVNYQPSGHYGVHANCSWAVQCSSASAVATFTFTALDTESGFDFVDLVDPQSGVVVAHLSGALSELDHNSYQTEGPAMRIRFSSDGSVSGNGFGGAYSCGPSHGDAGCVDHIDQLSGPHACRQYLATGAKTCAADFCSTCQFDHLCDKTCRLCGH